MRGKLLLLAALSAAPAARAVNITFQEAAPSRKAAPSFWPEGLRLSLSSLGYYKAFSGDPARASGIVDRPLSQEDLTVRFARKYSNGVELRQDLSGRHTNDRTLSRNKDFILQNLFLSAEKADRFAARFGNILTSFSRFTLGTSLQGANGYYQSGRLRFSGVAARQEEVDGGRYRRWTTGGRVEALNAPGPLPFIRGVSGGVSLVSTGDDGSSIVNQANVQKVDALVGGGDLRFDLRRAVTLTTEWAGSSFRDNRGARLAGAAFSLDLDWKPGRLAAGLGYENQDPGFRSPAGSASPDVRRLSPRSSYRFSDWASADLGAEFTRNNLFRQLAFTTNGETYRGGLNVRPLGWRKASPFSGLSTTLAVRLNRQNASDASAKRQTMNYDLAASHALGGLNYGLGYSLQTDKDLVKEANNRVVSTPRFNLGAQRALNRAWNFSLGPTYAWSYSRDTKVTTGEAAKTVTHDLGLGGTLDGGRFSLGFGVTSAQRPAPANASYQRRLRADWSQTLRPGLSLTFAYAHTYQTESDRLKNYDENQWSVGLKYEF